MTSATPRLLAVSWTPLWPLHGGAAIRSVSLLSHLTGLDVEALAPGPLPPGWRGVGRPRGRGPRLDFNPDILNAISPAVLAAARRRTRVQRPDAVLAFGIWSVPAALAAARGAPLVLDLAHIETATARETRPGDPRVGVLARIEAWAVRRANRIWVVSEEDRLRLGSLAPDAAARAVVVANGVEAPVAAERAPSGPPRALFAGRMSFAPNRDAALFLAREVAPLWTRGRILVAGESPPAGLRGVDVAATPREMAPLYAQARLACAPVFAGSGVRNKVLEAARFGVPLVASGRAVEGFGLRSGVHYLRAESPDEHVRAFDALLDDDALAERLVEAARERTASLSWEASAARAHRDLSELLCAAKPTAA